MFWTVEIKKSISMTEIFLNLGGHGHLKLLTSTASYINPQ